MPSPALSSVQRVVAAINAATSSGISLDPDNTANTKGVYADLFASTAFVASGILVTYLRNINTPGSFLIDIAIGAGGQEQIIVSNLLMQRQQDNFPTAVFIPLRIPAGVRLSARAQCSSANETDCVISVHLVAGGALAGGGLQRCTTYGADTSDTGGTGIDPGGAANTKGAYTEITAATTAPIKWLILAIGNKKNSTMTDCQFLIDIGIGAATEQIVIPDLSVTESSFMDVVAPPLYALPVDIPTGTRLTARCQCSSTDATDRLIDIILYGVG